MCRHCDHDYTLSGWWTQFCPDSRAVKRVKGKSFVSSSTSRTQKQRGQRKTEVATSYRLQSVWMKPQEVVSLDMFKYIQQELALNFAITLTHCHITVVGQETFGCVNNSKRLITPPPLHITWWRNSVTKHTVLQKSLIYWAQSSNLKTPIKSFWCQSVSLWFAQECIDQVCWMAEEQDPVARLYGQLQWVYLQWKN